MIAVSSIKMRLAAPVLLHLVGFLTALRGKINQGPSKLPHGAFVDALPHG